LEKYFYCPVCKTKFHITIDTLNHPLRDAYKLPYCPVDYKHQPVEWIATTGVPIDNNKQEAGVILGIEDENKDEE